MARLLVVDDDPGILRAVQRILRDHELVCVDAAEAALARIQEGERFDVILTDVMMPGMTGVELYDTLCLTYPALAPRVVFMTGGVPDPQIARTLHSIPNPKLEKPMLSARLRDVIQQTFDP